MVVRSSLATKMLLLLALPLLSQLFVVITLAQLEAQVESEAEKSEHVRKLVTSVKEFEQLCYRYTLEHAGERSLAVDSVDPRAVQEVRTDSFKLVKNIEDMSGYDDQIRKAISEMRRLMNKSFGLYDQLRENWLLYGNQQEKGVDARRPIWKQMRFILVDIHEQVKTIGAGQSEIEAASIDQEASYREKFRNVLLIGSFVSALSIVLIAVFLIRDVVGRLDILRDNAIRLVRNVPLHKPLRGDDEIAVLDNTFHAMAMALEEMAFKERAIIDNAQDVICALDREYAFVTSNPAIETIVGLPVEQILGKHISEFLVHEYISPAMMFFDQIRTGESVPHLEVEMVDTHGLKSDTLWTAVWSRKEKSLFCVVHNITMRRQAERLREEAIAMLNHDLRAPIMSIRMILESLESGDYGKLDQEGTQLVQRGSAGCSRLLQMTKDLLDLDRMRTGALQLDLMCCDIAQIAFVAAEMTEASSRKKELTVDAELPSLLVLADGQRLEQVVTNLVSNAIKFSPRGSTISITASNKAGMAEVCVEDRGSGISEDQLQLIFERYKQAEPSGHARPEGSGLGLAICKSMVELHGGKIWAHSQVGLGTRVFFTVPLFKKESEQKLA